MERAEVLRQIKEYFTIDELVCQHVYARWGEDAWQFLDTNFLHCLLLLRRDIIGKPMHCNTHRLHIYQRGLRCNMCEIVKEKGRAYLSAHILGKAGDFNIEGMTAAQARQRIKLLPAAFPCQVRVEGGVSWLHFDVLPQSGISNKVYEFTATR